MKQSDKVVLEYVKVSPETAKDWLAKNITLETSDHNNRKLKPFVVSKYMDRMKNERWNERNGETIKFDRDGNLIDGQHRLQAQVELGLTLHWSVAYNCSPEAFVTIDDGSTRSTADAASMVGEQNANVFAAALTLWHRYESKAMLFGGYGAPDNKRIVEMLRNGNADAWRESVSLACNNRAAKGLLSPSIAAFIHYVGTATQGREKADAFILGVCTGGGDSSSHAVTMLRNRLIENATAARRVPRVVVVAWCVKAWNCYVSGRKLGKGGLRYKHRPSKDDSGKIVSPSETFPSML